MTRVVVRGDVEVADGEDAGARAVDVGPLGEPDRLERVDCTLAESAGQLGPRDRELQEERADDRAEAAFVLAWGKATGAETYPSRARADDWSGRGKLVSWPLGKSRGSTSYEVKTCAGRSSRW